MKRPPRSPKGKEEADDEDYNLKRLKRVEEKRSKEEYFMRSRFYSGLFSRVLDVIISLATCGGQFELRRREIAFRYNIDGVDTMTRNDVFNTREELMGKLIKSAPSTVMFGGIFLGSLNDPRRVRERFLCTKDGCSAYGQFCIDVDMDDYHRDGIRNGVCHCPKYTVCNACWAAIMEPGRAVLDYLLRTVMGFKAIFYVFSGRRGYHVWVLDRRVVTWTADQRGVVINRLQNLMWDDEQVADVVYDLLWPPFEKHYFKNPRQPFKCDWELLEGCTHPRDIARIKRKAVFTTLYPRLDLPVSKDVTHLIKLPLVLHHSTAFFTMPLPSPGHHQRFEPDTDSIRATDISTGMILNFSTPIRRALEIAYKNE